MRNLFLLAIAAIAAMWISGKFQHSELPREALQRLIERVAEEPAMSQKERQRLDALIERLNEIPETGGSIIAISDGKFNELSKKWRQGIDWLLTTGRCRAYEQIIWHAVDGNRFKFLLAKAQMMVESGCRWDIVGGGTDHGLFQVQEGACKDVGIEGDLFDPETNVRCAIAYHRTLCKRYGKCELTDMVVAYNAGPTGSERVKNKRAHQYARKIHFALERVMKHERRIASR